MNSLKPYTDDLEEARSLIKDAPRDPGRRRMMLNSLFVGMGVSALEVPSLIARTNDQIESSEQGVIAPKSAKSGALAISTGSICDGYDFPLRQEGIDHKRSSIIATDSALIYFVWPSERGSARGYVRPWPCDLKADRLVFRLRQGAPEAPYYLRWRKGDYYLYTPPGALVKRASWFLHFRQSEDENERFQYLAQAISDLRMAVLINLSARGSGQEIVNRMTDLDNSLKAAPTAANLNATWEEYKTLLSQSRD